MKNIFKDKDRARVILTVFLVCLIAMASYCFLYRFDNKYTVKTPQASKGFLLLSEEDYDRTMFLVSGWEYYSGVLLNPSDFIDNNYKPDKYIFIGEYGGFDIDGMSPHGSASYRLRISIPEETKSYMLELPEIYSAYQLYINGKEMMAMGNPDPLEYYPQTGTDSVIFEAENSIEILFAVSDYSGLYSGMVYPPAFGAPPKVKKIIDVKLFFRYFICFIALTIGAMSLLISILDKKNKLNFLYGILCIAFIGYTSYPIINNLFKGFYSLYIIERFSFCSILLIVTILQSEISNTKTRLVNFFIAFGFFMVTFTIFSPYLFKSGNLKAMYIYSDLIGAYKWMTMSFITVTLFSKLKQNNNAILYSIVIFDSGLVMDRLLPLYEPIITGWFIELASFGLVIAYGIEIAKNIVDQYSMNLVLTERNENMEKISQMQITYFKAIEEKNIEINIAQHDIRHHFRIISRLIENNEYDGLYEYVEKYNLKVSSENRIMQSGNRIIDIVTQYYSDFSKQNSIEFTEEFFFNKNISISDTDLNGLLSNLLENAAEACLSQSFDNRYIHLSIIQKKAYLKISIINSSDGTTTKTLAMPNTKHGYGLASVKNIADCYNGYTEFKFDENKKEFYSNVIICVYDNEAGIKAGSRSIS